MAPARPLALLGACAILAAGCGSEEAEGRPWIKKLTITGNHALDEGAIVDHIALDETSWIPLSPKHYFDPVTLELDRRRIEALYHAHGYFFARVRSASVVPDGKDAVDVRIDVDEGPVTTVDAVQVRGLDPLGAAYVAKIVKKLPIRRGQPFVHQRYLSARGLIHARLRADGFAFVEVHGVAKVDRRARTAVIVFEVDPGPRARFGSVVVQGQSAADPRLVAERAAFSPGDRFDPEKLDTTRDRIYHLGIFSTVRVDVVRDAYDPAIANVLVTVHPSTLNELRLGGGFGFEGDRQDVHLRVQYTRRNFLGGLRTLTLRLQPGWVFFPTFWSSQRSGPAISFDGTLTQPGFLVRNLSLRALVGYDLGIDYAFRYHGPRGSLGVDYAFARLHDRLILSFAYNVQYLQFYDTVPTFLQDPTQSRLFFGYTNPYPLAYLSGEVQLDLRDRPLSPRKGGYFDFPVENGAPYWGGSFRYWRVQPDLRGYLPIGSRLVLAARAQWGEIWDASQGSPITRRFYAGGPDSHRGFNFHRLSPQVPSGTTLPPIPVGGDTMFLGQLEARARLFRIRGSAFGVTAFVDAGDVPERGRSLDFTQLHVAVGGGLRYQTVVGTVRADLGVRLNRLAPLQPDGRQNPDPGSRFAFHLSIGEAF